MRAVTTNYIHMVIDPYTVPIISKGRIDNYGWDLTNLRAACWITL